MANLLRSPKDLWAGLIYIAFGAAILYIGAEYRLGTAGRMGPGYFPKALAWLLVGVGLISLVRAFMTRGDEVGGIAWRPLLLILLAGALFAWALPRLGLSVALLALVLVSASASQEFKFDTKAALGLLALIVFCTLVFVKGLGVPMPLWGEWLEPFAAKLPQWAR